MDGALSAFLSWQLILFSLGIFFLIWIVRTIVEFCSPAVVKSRAWTDLFLRLSPVIVGAIVGYFATGFPYPFLSTAMSGRVLFGVVSGGLSSLLYGSIKSMAKGYIQGIAQGILNATGSAPPCIAAPIAVSSNGINNPNTGMGMGVISNEQAPQ